MKNTFYIFFLLLFICVSSFAQNKGYYYNYSFEQYAKEKMVNPDKFISLITSKIDYPAIARENSVEGRLNFLLINHGTNQIELILKNVQNEKEFKKTNLNNTHNTIFIHSINKAFKSVSSKYEKPNTEKYMVEIDILFDMEPYESDTNKSQCDIIVLGKKVDFIIKSIY